MKAYSFTYLVAGAGGLLGRELGLLAGAWVLRVTERERESDGCRISFYDLD